MDGDLRCFTVADFSDHDDVGILPENRPQACRKRQIDFRIHLHLADAEQLIFDRILDGDDVFVRRIDVAERGIEGRGFSAAGWARHKDDAVRKLNQLMDY
jgi:hypothetical protein